MDETPRKQILVVEDDGHMFQLLQTELAQAGFEPVQAHDGPEGITRAIANPPQLIILDILLPGVDGMQVLDTLRAHEKTKNVPVIILTNLSADEEIMQNVMRNHPSYYIVKSNTSVEAIIAKVKEVLEPAK
jgi:DNA-binding response OmpR family regulator